MSATRRSSATDDCPIAIIGMGCLFPNAANLAEFWRSLRRGEDGITEVPPTHWAIRDHFDPDPKATDRTYCARGGFLSPAPFDPTEFGIPPTVLEATDTSQLLSLIVAKAALEDAGYGEGRDFNRERVSVLLGVTGTQELVLPLAARLGRPHWQRALQECGVSADVAEQVISRIAENYVSWQENSFPGLLGNVVAGRIANRLNLRGTNCVVDAACASSLGAVHLATLELAAGRCDMALTGGADTFNDVFMYMCFSKTTALSPTGDARPFSDDADGTVLGEGLGMLVLKRLADAERDGDRIYAVIRGIGTSSDGRSQSIYSPHAAGQARALRNAYRQAGFGPETVELIEAHGTGTRVGDVTEFEALRSVFREARGEGQWCAVGSVKSQIGHTKAAAGAAGLIKAALAIYHRALPPTIKVRQPNSRMNVSESPFYVSTELRPWVTAEDRPRRAGVSAFGFGGSNFHAVIEEHQATLPAVAWDGSVEIIPLAAVDEDGLRQQVDEWLAASREGRLGRDELAFRAATARRMFSTDRSCRLVIVHERDANLTESFEKARRAIGAEAPTGPAAGSVFYGTGPAEGRVVALFPGQGSQYVSMLRQLTCTFPELTAAFREAEAINDPAQGGRHEHGASDRLSEIVFPRPAWTDAERNRQAAGLTRTEIAQPALGAVCLGLWRILQRFEVAVDIAAGHSYGELAALCAAGRIDGETLHRLSRLRGRVMAESGGDRGTMLAVRAPLAEVDRLVAERRLDVVVANRNAPQQAVLSGSRDAIALAAEACAASGFATKALRVSGAFHSRLMEGAAAPFRQALEAISISTGGMTAYANVTGLPYPDDAAATRDLLGRQLLHPVDFVGLVENIYAAGVRTFVEVGPKSVLSGLVRSILADRPHTVVAVDASGGRLSGLADLAKTLALLAAQGRAVNLAQWERPPREPRRPKMVIPLVGANYRSSMPQRTEAVMPNGSPADPAAALFEDSQMTYHADEPVPAVPGGPSTPDAFSALNVPAPPTEPASSRTPTPHPGSHSVDSGVESAGTEPDSPPVSRAALQLVQEGLAALQRIQQQTAEAHQRFLDVQSQAQRAFMMLLTETGRPPSESGTISPPVAATPPSIHVQRSPGGSISTAAVTSSPVPMLPAATPVAPPVRPMSSPAATRQTPVGPTVLPKPPTPARPDVAAMSFVVLDVVSEKTGYPREMIGLDMEIEADLGIDSIKRVEIMAAIEERVPGWGGVQPGDMGGLRTLGEIVGLLSGEEAGAVPAQPVPATSPAPTTPEGGAIGAKTGIARLDRVTPPAATASAPRDYSATLLSVVAELTGYPREMLNLDMDMESDLGIDSIKRVEILAAVESREPSLPPVRPEVMGGLRTLRQIVASFGGPVPTAAHSEPSAPATPTAAAAESTAALPPVPLAPALVRRRILKRVQLPPTGPIPATRASLPAWLATPERTTWVTDDGQGLATAVVEHLSQLGLPARLIDITTAPAEPIDVGGLIIVAPSGAAAPAPWNTTTEDYLKSAFALVRGCATSLRSAAAAGGALLATVARLDGAFGLSGGSFDSAHGGLAGLVKTAAQEWPGVCCRALDVAASWHEVRAAAGAVVAELAENGPSEVGLTPDGRCGVEAVEAAAAVEPLKIATGEVFVFTGGARGVTAACALELARSCRPTLVLLGRSPAAQAEPAWLQGLEGEAAVKEAILRHALPPGASPADLQARWRRIIANREIHRHLEQLEETGAKVIYREVDVRRAKAVQAVIREVRESLGPVRGLVHAAGVLADRRIEDKTPEQFAAVFDTKVVGLRNLLAAVDSTELRYLALFSSVAARFGNIGQSDYAVANEVLNKAARRLAADWPHCRVTAFNWGPWDGGMVGPALRKKFAADGVPLIPLSAGAAFFVSELACVNKTDIEIIIGGDLPATPSKAPAPAASTSLPSGLAAEVSPTPSMAATTHTAFDRELDPARHVFLGSHVLDGRPVLPLAMMMEWIGHAAVHANPGLLLHGLDRVRVLKGVVVRDRPPLLRFLCGRPRREGGVLAVDVEVRSSPTDSAAGEPGVLHARAAAILADTLPAAAAPLSHVPPEGPFPGGIARAYGDILFHGPHFHGLEEIVGCSPEGLVARVRSSPTPTAWMDDPLRSEWLTDPLVLDAVFQMGTLWCHEHLGMVSLPNALARYRQYRRQFPPRGLRVVLHVRHRTAHGMTADVALLDASGGVVATMDGFECTADAALAAAFRRRTLAAASTRG